MQRESALYPGVNNNVDISLKLHQALAGIAALPLRSVAFIYGRRSVRSRYASAQLPIKFFERMKMITLARAILTTAFVLASLPALAANCDPTDVQSNINSCRDACRSSGHQPECNGSGTMDLTSQSNDGAGVVRGFEVCHPDRNGKDKSKDEVIEACYNADHLSVVKIACVVYGRCRPPALPPIPTVKSTDFNLKMFTSSDNKQAVIAEFDIAGTGTFQGITVNYHRDGKEFTLMNTYAVGVTFDGKFHIKVTAYDYTVRDASKHTYEVAGSILILTPP